MSTYDAQENNTDRVAQKYVDLDLFFGRKSSNSDVQDLTNIKDTKDSLNIFKQGWGENLDVHCMYMRCVYVNQPR